MAATESGTYRVFESDRDGPDLLLVERGSEEPLSVRTEGYDEPLASTVAGLRPGNLIDATLSWGAEGPPAFAEVDVRTETLFAFVDGVPDVFEEARTTFEQGKREHMPIYSNVTYDPDGEPNGAIYTVAKQQGETDVFADLSTGRLTMEPMLEKLGEGGAEPPYEAFVLRPVDDPFVVVYFVLEKGGQLAETMRREYDCPRE
ncbi:MAG: DUF6663 family protein [Haloarculaceae archaeon]